MNDENVLMIEGCKLVLTCESCPEQYDVYLNEEQIGYLRLRHGYFRADYPTCGGQTVMTTNEFRGDGQFEDDEERMKYLTLAVQALLGSHSEYKV